LGQPIRRINDFAQLLSLVTQTEEGLQKYLYSRLEVGDMWWIPDSVSGFGQKESHPWVVVVPFKTNRPPVLACPRTTKQGKRKDQLYTPAGILPGLNKEGVILLGFRRSFEAAAFRDFDYIGRLSDEWVRKIGLEMRKQLGSTK